MASGATSVQALTGQDTLYGYAVRESAVTPAAASFVLHDGTATTDPIIVPQMNLAASGNQIAQLPAIPLTTGIFVERVSGSTEIVFYID